MRSFKEKHLLPLGPQEQTISTFSPKYNDWRMIKIKEVHKTFETENFGWAVVTHHTGCRIIVCLG